MHLDPQIDLPALLGRYSAPGPRYTSYPTAPAFGELSETAYRDTIRQSNVTARPLSLYFHLPFCSSLCYFCACNVVYTKDRNRAEPYLQRLLCELQLLADVVDLQRPLSQLHLGGGTPTFFEPRQIEALLQGVETTFRASADREFSVELDPRATTAEHVDALADCGFQRASLGVQDTELRVQEAVNRIQPMEQTARLVDLLRKRDFASINVDLIYGLPLQTADSFARTVDDVLQLRPERISLFHFAYVPGFKKHQQTLDRHERPDSATRIQIFSAASRALFEAGYVHIGMDHFALPGDEIAQAAAAGKLHRNFQGYTTRGHCDLFGLGLSSIGYTERDYFQNSVQLAEYEARVDAGRLPVVRGIRLSQDDLIRRRVIMDLMSQFEVRPIEVARDFGIDFEEYFAPELKQLPAFASDGLLEIDLDGIRITAPGRFVVRNICMVFDAYLGEQAAAGRTFSKTV